MSTIEFASLTPDDLNLPNVAKYLQSINLIDANESIEAKRFVAGTSNPTYLLASTKSRRQYVLRRKPFGKLLPGAHQIDREYEVAKRLASVDFPVAKPFAYCADASVTGSEFYITTYVQGRVFRGSELKDAPSPEHRAKCYASMLETVARLHEIDAEAIGLAPLLITPEKAKVSYVFRQLKTWNQNYRQSLDPSTGFAPSTAELMGALYAHLETHLPAQRETTLIHGDYKMDQLIFHPTEPKVIAVVDLEMVTIGDPIADVTYALATHLMDTFGPGAFRGFGGTVYDSRGQLLPGIPSLDSAMFLYSSHRRSSKFQLPSKAEMAIYSGYQMFRVAAISQVVAARVVRRTSSATNLPISGMMEITDTCARLGARYLVDAPPPSVATAVSEDSGGSGEKKKNAFFNHALAPKAVFRSSPTIPALSPRARDLLVRLVRFMEEKVYPSEALFERQLQTATLEGRRWSVPGVLEELKGEAKKQGLWNLFLPEWSGISNRDYATLAEVMGRNLWCAEVFNCQFPDTGNMETLHLFGTKAQRSEFLEPLRKGELRSAFVMTEPGVASSDAVQLKLKIEKRSDSYLLNGKKWWISGAGDPRCKIFLVLGDTSVNERDEKKRAQIPRHRRHSVVIVPADTPGIKIKTPMTTYNYDDAPFGHFEVDFDNVVVPLQNLLKEEGAGFEIAQARLGPGRLHHCMRTIGLGERAIELLLERMKTRSVKGGTLLKDIDSLRVELAHSRIELNASRLTVLRAAAAMDEVGAKNAMMLVSSAKVKVPNDVLKIIDKAIQVHGGVGLSHQFPLASWFARTRTVRFMDGPDASHLEVIAKSELEKEEKERSGSLKASM